MIRMTKNLKNRIRKSATLLTLVCVIAIICIACSSKLEELLLSQKYNTIAENAEMAFADNPDENALLNTNQKYIKVGENFNLIPRGYAPSDFTWKSYNEDVATVSESRRCNWEINWFYYHFSKK